MKAVLSGDTVILMGTATGGGPPPEMQLTLASLQAPRLGHHEVKDEPWAWQSRDFLRSRLIGKRVQFTVEYRVAAIGRDFGAVELDGENVCVAVAREGWARVKEAREGEASKDYEEMARLGAAAEAAKRGVYNDQGAEASVREVKQQDSFDANELVEEFRGRRARAVIGTSPAHHTHHTHTYTHCTGTRDTYTRTKNTPTSTAAS